MVELIHLFTLSLREMILPVAHLAFSEKNAAKVAVGFLRVLHHSAEGALSSDAADLLICQRKTEELRDLLHSFWKILEEQQKERLRLR